MGLPLVRAAPVRNRDRERRSRSSEQQPATCDHRSATSDQPLTEAALAELWSGQRFPAAALVTRQGITLRVLHPGLRGRGAGPDFHDAIIATPAGGLLQGDVELHLRASDFRAHGHHRDGRYDRVVLHVVLEDDTDGDTCLANGARAPVVALSAWGRRRSGELASWLSAPSRWREPCHDAVDRLGREAVLAALAALGERRFRERETVVAVRLEGQGPGEALYRALLEGLGYGGDRGLVEEVGELLPWRELAGRLAAAPEARRSLVGEALLLAAAGLLSPASRHPYEQMLSEEGARQRWPAMPAAGRSPEAGAARPANHPARRLAGLAELIVRHGPDFQRAASSAALETPPPALVAAWSVPAAGYWRRHLAPGVEAPRALGALIGRSRAIELLVNAVLPWAAALAEGEGEPERAALARAAFARLPRPGRYGALAFLERNLAVGGRALPLEARRQQGLLALYKTECTQGGCGRCPLS